jgi:hypothetical protein
LQTLLPPLRADQDPTIRCLLVKSLRSTLHRTLSNSSLTWLCNEIIANVFREDSLDVRKEIFHLIVDKCNMTPEDSAEANEVVKCLCTQIRAMVKEMRVECADLLCSIKHIADATVVQMIQKESFF